MKIRPVGAELFHADGQTVRHDEANVAFHNFANAPKPDVNLLHSFMVVSWYYHGINEYRQHTSVDIHTDKLSAL